MRSLFHFRNLHPFVARNPARYTWLVPAQPESVPLNLLRPLREYRSSQNTTKKGRKGTEGGKREERKEKTSTNEKERVFPSRWKRRERQRCAEEKQGGSTIIA